MQHIALTPEERTAIAKAAGTSRAYLYQILTRRRKANPALAVRLNKADARLRLQDLRPDDWRDIWPDLAAREVQP